MLEIDIETAVRTAHAAQQLDRATRKRVDRQGDDDLSNRFGAFRILGGTSRRSTGTASAGSSPR